ncbi:MAG: ATP-binding protein [Pseudomonadota bacterium]
MDPEVLKRTIERERKRREEAERLLEEKSRELYLSYRQLEEAHAELKANKDRLVQSEKMASLGVMAAGVAHEINNPLGFVSSNLSTLDEYLAVFRRLIPLVKRQLATPSEETLAAIQALYENEDFDFLLEDTADLVRESGQGLERVQAIVAGLKRLSFSGTGKLGPIDLIACLDETVLMVRGQLTRDCTIETRYVELPPILGNSGQLGQVFMNLLVNAAHAVREVNDPRVVIEVQPVDEGVEVTVADNGCGISPEHQTKLFQPFFTTKAVGEGTGLGLSISHGIMQEHGGEIRCESAEGAGSRFTVRLRLALAASDPE